MNWKSTLARLSIVVLVLSAVAWGQETKSLNVPKTETPPKIDGSLDDPCWANAPKGDQFVLRSIGKPPMEPTEFFVCYDDTSIYFGFYCHDSQPDKIKATQTERDSNLRIDDCIQIYLDTYHEHRSADEFFVNALGTQRDERKRGTAEKISWKGDWHAAARRVADGWTAEMAIPFAILNYKPGTTSMGLNVRRDEQRLGEVSDWNYLDNGDQYARYGDLVGLLSPAPHHPPLQVMPYVLRSLEFGAANAGRVGMDIKKPFGDDNAILFTAFPDFGTIENAVKSIDFSYTAHRYEDNRPFFQEAGSIFSSPYLYSTDIPDFDYGAKVFGRQNKFTYGAMGCATLGTRTDSMATLGYDLPALTHATLSMVRRHDDTVDNNVYSLRLGGQPIPSTSWWMRGARSLTAGASENGSDLDMGLEYSGARWSFDGYYGKVSRYFNPADAYLDYPGSSALDFGGSYDVDHPGKKLRSWGFDFGTGQTWDTDHGLIERATDFGLYAGMANHTSFSFGHEWGPHIANYDEGGPYEWNSDSESYVSYSFLTNDQYRSGGLSYNWGRVGGGPTRSIRFNCGFLPMPRFSTGLSLRYAQRNNPEEGSVKPWLRILSAKYQLTPEKSIAARLLSRKEGANLTFSYRQRVRQGLDIFALIGDYNADHTVNRISFKLIASQ